MVNSSLRLHIHACYGNTTIRLLEAHDYQKTLKLKAENNNSNLTNSSNSLETSLNDEKRDLLITKGKFVSSGILYEQQKESYKILESKQNELVKKIQVGQDQIIENNKALEEEKKKIQLLKAETNDIKDELYLQEEKNIQLKRKKDEINQRIEELKRKKLIVQKENSKKISDTKLKNTQVIVEKHDRMNNIEEMLRRLNIKRALILRLVLPLNLIMTSISLSDYYRSGY
jgi:hypothetical protein